MSRNVKDMLELFAAAFVIGYMLRLGWDFARLLF